MTVSAFLLVGSALGATLVYALSEAFFPDPTRAVTPAKKDTDEYVRLLPMVGPTRTGGIIGSLVGQF